MSFSYLLSSVSRTCKSESVRHVVKHNTRYIFQWLNIIFNQIDQARVKKIGPDHACAEWLLRNGAAIQWVGCKKFISDYNCLQSDYQGRHQMHIEKVDASDSSISHHGFLHFRNCKYIRELILHNCYYIEDEALRELGFLKNSLEYLRVTRCGNITDNGLFSLKQMSNLKTLEIGCLPYVKQKADVLLTLKNDLPNCNIISDFENE